MESPSCNDCTSTFASGLVTSVRERIDSGQLQKRKFVWLELTGCSGNIISLLDGNNPDFKYLASQMVQFVYDNSLIVKQGQKAMEQLFSVIGSDFILAVEGAVSTKDNGIYNIIGKYQGQPVTAYEAIKRLGEAASHVIAVGACASDGGVSAARPNPAKCVSVQSVLERKVIKLPGCPCNPDWFLGTLAHILLFGEPELDATGRPTLFYGTPSTTGVRGVRISIKVFSLKNSGMRRACLSSAAAGRSRGQTAPSGDGTNASTGQSETIRRASAALSLVFPTGWSRLSALIQQGERELHEEGCYQSCHAHKRVHGD